MLNVHDLLTDCVYSTCPFNIGLPKQMTSTGASNV